MSEPLTIGDEVRELIDAARIEVADLNESMGTDERDAQRALVGLCFAATAIAIVLAVHTGLTVPPRPEGTE